MIGTVNLALLCMRLVDINIVGYDVAESQVVALPFSDREGNDFENIS